MKKLFLSLISSLLLTSVAKADLDFNEIKQSVYKIVVLKKVGVPNSVLYSATGFFVNDEKLGNVLITNTHVCDSMYRGVPAIVLSELGDIKTKDDIEMIGWIYLAPGMDICVAKLMNQTKEFPTLDLSSKQLKKYQKVTITGFDGEDQMLVSEGYLYGKVHTKYFEHVIPTDPSTTKPLSAEYYMSSEFKSIPGFKDVVQYKSTALIAPGYSGSPVLDEKGEVIGIANAYDPPCETSIRSFSYFFSVDDIKEALAKAKLRPYLDPYFAGRKSYLQQWIEINNDVDWETYKEKVSW